MQQPAPPLRLLRKRRAAAAGALPRRADGCGGMGLRSSEQREAGWRVARPLGSPPPGSSLAGRMAAPPILRWQMPARPMPAWLMPPAWLMLARLMPAWPMPPAWLILARLVAAGAVVVRA